MNTDGISNRTLAAWELISAIVSCLVAEWVVLAFGNRLLLAIPVAFALTQMMFSHRVYRETPRELGFRGDNFLAALKVLVLPTVVAIVAVMVISNQYLPREPVRGRFLLVPLWAL